MHAGPFVVALHNDGMTGTGFVMKQLLMAAFVAMTGCSGPERPAIMGVKFGEVYGAPVATECELNQRYEMTSHDQAFSCQLEPP